MSSSDRRGVGDGGRGCTKHFKKHTMTICYMCNFISFDLLMVIIEDFQARNWKNFNRIHLVVQCNINTGTHTHTHIYIYHRQTQQTLIISSISVTRLGP
jgi:hypothetical protein